MRRPEVSLELVRDLVLGLVLSVMGGLALVAVSMQWESYGYAFAVGLPFTVGAIFGYVATVGRAMRALGVILVVAGVITGAVTAGLAGVLCGLVAAILFIVPALVGAVVGAEVARRVRGRTATRIASSLLLLVAAGALLRLDGGVAPGLPEETIATSRVLDMDPARAWELMQFYEEVEHQPPLLARIGLPHPLRTEGEVRGPGDVKRCVYTTGYLRKRITALEPGRRLEFDVIEQHGVEDRSVELVRGSFAFAPLEDGRTRVTLTTVYRPLLSARLAWRPFEASVTHALHDHVLDGMERSVPPRHVARAWSR